MKKVWQHELTRYLGIGILTTIVSFFFLQLPLLASINNLFADLLQSEVEPRGEIIIVAIDDQSLQEIGAWPWPRTVIASTVQNILNDNPAVIGVDVLFLEEREGDEFFAQVLGNAEGKVVLGSKITEDGVLKSHLADSSDSGFVNFPADVDGKIRKAAIWQETESECLFSLGLRTYSKYLGINDLGGCQSQLELRGGAVPTDQGELNFSYTRQDFRRVRFSDVYNGRVDSAVFEDKIVLIGSTALDLRSSLNDNFTDIFGQSIPGVELHANIINSFLQNSFSIDPHPLVVLAVLLLFVSIFNFGYYLIKKDVLDLILWMVAVGLQFGGALILYAQGIRWPVFTSIIVITLSYIGVSAFKFFTKSKENRYIKQVFSRYLSAKLLGKLLDDPSRMQLGGELREMTVLFSDIRSFTTISEGLSSTDLIHMLNDYLNYMSKLILNNDGTIDKYIGDAIMAFWNAPIDDGNHVNNGVVTALEMADELNKFVEGHPEYPEIKIGIGVNTGNMTVGNVGGDARFDYTVLGDNVNLGARLEGLTKKYGVTILCTEYTVAGFSDDRVIFREIDDVIVKGKTSSVKIFEPLWDNQTNQKLVENYANGYKEYKDGNFDFAIEQLAKFPSDAPSHKLRERCEFLLENPPRDWQGVWTWDEK